MLRDFGVKGVKVQEVVSLDEDMMAFLKYDISTGLREHYS
jgi:ubiquitin carboxyl-terminal hydrolase L5